jgi:hypothetical protein
MVEPSAAATGALHAQLLHAAAQRAKGASGAPRGKVLQFVRRVAMHPAYAAAAAFLIVGGAVGIQLTRGKLMMPAPTVQTEPVPAAAEPVVTATPAGPTPPAGAPASPSANGPVGFFKNDGTELAKAAEAQSKLDSLSKQAKEELPENSVGVDVGGKRLVAKPSPRREVPPSGYTNTVPAPKVALKSDSNDPLGNINDPIGGVWNGKDSTTVGDVVSNERSRKGAKPVLVDTPQAPVAAHHAAAGGATRGAAGEQNQWNADTNGLMRGGETGTVTSRPAAVAPPPPPPSSSAPAAAPTPEVAAAAPAEKSRGESRDDYKPQDGRYRSGVSTGSTAGAGQASTWDNKKSVAAPSAAADKQGALTRSGDALRKKAEELATTGRCDEAVKLYQELEKTYPTYRIAPADRLPYVRCLRQTGRLQQASDELDSLKRDKANTNRLIQDEELQLQQQMRAPAKQQVAQPKPATKAPLAPAPPAEAPSQQAQAPEGGRATKSTIVRQKAKKAAQPADDAFEAPARPAAEPNKAAY